LIAREGFASTLFTSTLPSLQQVVEDVRVLKMRTAQRYLSIRICYCYASTQRYNLEF
jgi:hypothetical protein